MGCKEPRLYIYPNLFSTVDAVSEELAYNSVTDHRWHPSGHYQATYDVRESAFLLLTYYTNVLTFIIIAVLTPWV